MTQEVKKHNKNLYLFIAFVLVVIIVLPFGLATAGVTITPIEGNDPTIESCYWLKIDPPNSGTYQEGDLEVTVEFKEDGTVLDWSSNLPISHVFVKGGNVGGKLYSYDPTVNLDSGLIAGTNHNDNNFQISHVTFFWCVEEPKPGNIDGSKFNDLNGDGIWDQDELGLEGWEIKLVKDAPPGQSGSTVVQTVYTDANGAYSFSSVSPGMYYLCEVQQEGWTQTVPTDPDYLTVNLTAGQNLTGLYFGNKINLKDPEDPEDPQYGSIAGIKFNDIDGDGIWDEDELALEGWTITLHSGIPSVNNVVYSDTTGSDGAYSFTGLQLGTYYVTETQQEGWTQTAPNEPGYYIVTLEEGDINGKNFGNKMNAEEPQYGSISGSKFKDIDGDGVWGQDEPGLEGWQINLVKDAPPGQNGSTIVQSVYTNQNGEYSFTNLASGTYYVDETQVTGWVQTAPSENSYFTINIEAGQTLTERNFGNKLLPQDGPQYGSINGSKFNDIDMDGIWDENEPALKNWKINLFKDNAPVNPATATPYLTTITDVYGIYSFTDLTPGTYYVYEKVESGWIQSAPQSVYHMITISSDQYATGLNFGNYRISSGGGGDSSNDGGGGGGGGGTGGDDDGIIEVPGVASPVEETDLPEEIDTIILPPAAAPIVTVSPTRVPAGDPLITVKTGSDAKEVYAILPDGRKVTLKEVKPGLWKKAFMVPFGTPDGPYDIKVFVVGANGAVQTSSFQITIDNSLPVMKINQLQLSDNRYRLEIKPLFNATEVYYVTESGEWLTLTRDSKGIWSGTIPAGKGYILAVDETGYEVKKDLSTGVQLITKAMTAPGVIAAGAQVAVKKMAEQTPIAKAGNNYNNLLIGVIILSIVAIFTVIALKLKRV